jgi:hypothetical protein
MELANRHPPSHHPVASSFPTAVGLQLASLSTTSIGESNDQTDSYSSIRRVVPRRTWLSAIENQEKRVHKTEGYYSFGRIQIIF